MGIQNLFEPNAYYSTIYKVLIAFEVNVNSCTNFTRAATKSTSETQITVFLPSLLLLIRTYAHLLSKDNRTKLFYMTRINPQSMLSMICLHICLGNMISIRGADGVLSLKYFVDI